MAERWKQYHSTYSTGSRPKPKQQIGLVYQAFSLRLANAFSTAESRSVLETGFISRMGNAFLWGVVDEYIVANLETIRLKSGDCS